MLFGCLVVFAMLLLSIRDVYRATDRIRLFDRRLCLGVFATFIVLMRVGVIFAFSPDAPASAVAWFLGAFFLGDILVVVYFVKAYRR